MNIQSCESGQCADAACLLIAITTPITFWSYGKMVQLCKRLGTPTSSAHLQAADLQLQVCPCMPRQHPLSPSQFEEHMCGVLSGTETAVRL